MALNSSGPISLGGSTAGQSIAVELGQSSTGQISLNDSAVRTLAGVASGAIIMPTDFWGKSNSFSFNLSGNNVNLRTAALAAGWNGTSQVIATITNATTIYSTSQGTPALTVNGSFPAGVSLTNNGSIIACGGNGGNGGNASSGNGQAGSPGIGGGTALSVSVAITINNVGSIIGGGGGGGGGGGAYCSGSKGAILTGGGGGGGGGRTSTTNTTPGSGGSATVSGSPGTAGTLSAAGGGGSGGQHNQSAIYARGGNGGAGGAYGSSGTGGSNGTQNLGSSPSLGAGGSAGAAGSSIVGNSNITWTATGTRTGPIN